MFTSSVLLILLLTAEVRNAASQESKACRQYTTSDPCDPTKIKMFRQAFRYDFTYGSEVKYDYETKKITDRGYYNELVMDILLFPDIGQTIDDPDIYNFNRAYYEVYDLYGRFRNVITGYYNDLVSKDCYDISEGNLDYIAKCLAEPLTALGVEEPTIVGYGYGALLMTKFAEHFTSSKIWKTSALDPVGSPFADEDTDLVTAANISKYRECYHTNGNQWGVKCGQHDVHINPISRKQPGCQTEECSHLRALQFWVNSVKDKNAYYASQCQFFYGDQLYSCPQMPPYKRVGQFSELDPEGDWYLETDSEGMGKGKPEVVTTPTPDMVTTPSPEVVTTPTPDMVTTPSPEVVTTPTPEVVASPTMKATASASWSP